MDILEVHYICRRPGGSQLTSAPHGLEKQNKYMRKNPVRLGAGQKLLQTSWWCGSHLPRMSSRFQSTLFLAAIYADADSRHPLARVHYVLDNIPFKLVHDAHLPSYYWSMIQ
ncbi:hypothetical protein GGX14DRAFT_391906 [Mycena pura]|uniref:Uncharacterized protein n=1 Tax=Mycena pura TaxID=153505 RepID=A0AAD6VNK9_9AGAR|nr:hypothetical protein GGX14DRAFT_391906 [Mycena pura]